MFNPDWVTSEEQAIEDKPLSDGSPDPIKRYNDGWYFWDETWTRRFGPFDSKDAVSKSFDSYCKEVLGD